MEEEKTITLKKDTLWKSFVIILFVLLVVSVFTRGFGIMSTGSVVQDVNPDQQEAVDLSVFLDNPDLYPSLGPENAKDVVIEFSDFQCPFCAIVSGLPSWLQTYQTQYADLINSAGKIQAMAEQGKLRFIYVPMSFLGEESVYAAEAAYCAHEQGKFWEMHDAIFTAHDSKENNGKYSIANLKILAKNIQGLDTSKFNKCLDDEKYATAVETTSSQASTAASGTPTFYVNGEKMSGSWTQLSAALA
ncbi:MAG: thioredoxin domain-containing protein [Candidatus Pacearchaeota archaeon]|nr:thioredoxin domain-containing protein [Candidatus Pacearchaeota archaeon]